MGTDQTRRPRWVNVLIAAVLAAFVLGGLADAFGDGSTDDTASSTRSQAVPGAGYVDADASPSASDDPYEACIEVSLARVEAAVGSLTRGTDHEDLLEVQLDGVRGSDERALVVALMAPLVQSTIQQGFVDEAAIAEAGESASLRCHLMYG